MEKSDIKRKKKKIYTTEGLPSMVKAILHQNGSRL